VAITLPELGSDPWRFRPPEVDPQGALAPLVRAAGEEWDVGIARAAAFAAALTDLERAIDAATEGDPVAAAAVKRLLDADLPGLGAGVFIDAARHAAERNALAPASEDELADECLAAYITPHMRAD
jgi:hypothetical protein